MDKRYELFGWDYEDINPLSEKEVGWYNGFVRETGGPVLELACGTGRLLAEIAKQGFLCVGIDSSLTMLEIAGKHAGELSPEISSRIVLHRMDMADFELDHDFSLIIMADNSFQVIATREQQLSCLKCVHRHLRRNGKFLMAVRRFDPSAFSEGRREFGWSKPTYNPHTKETVRRRGEIELLEDGKRMCVVFYYKTSHKDGSETVEKCCSESPVMCTHNYFRLFSEAEFRPSVFVGYDERHDDGKDPILCFVCEKEQ